jgi:hypothetical protein
MTRAANLLILDGAMYPKMKPNPAYRGTCRMCPTHFDNLPEEHEANLLFYWFLEEGGELGVVHDERKARQLCNFCNTFGTDKSYEVVEAVVDNSKPVHEGEFLGFDISQGLNNSLLWWGLTATVPEKNGLPVRVLANVIFGLFSERLNDSGLFPDIETAISCRSALIALQALEPNLLEGDSLEKFAVVGLFRI